MTTIAQTYVHLKPFGLEKQQITALGEETVALAVKAAREVYDVGVSIEVKLEEGSLKAWVIVVCTGLPVLYNGLASYPDFKQGLSEAVEDARDFGDRIIGPFIQQSKAAPEEVYRTERRTMTPGKIDRGLSLLETARNSTEYQRALDLLRAGLTDLPQQQSEQVMRIVHDVYPSKAQPLARPGYSGLHISSTIETGSPPDTVNYVLSPHPLMYIQTQKQAFEPPPNVGGRLFLKRVAVPPASER